jgi:hypothetical protein
MTWVIAVGFGIRALYAYSTEPGSQATAPALWPEESKLAAPSGRPSIVMFVHPECPCTRASLAELQEIANHVGDRASISISSDDLEAARFGAKTSGHVVVYDAFGIRRYSGGITGSRGHVGDNVGRRLVEQIIDGAPGDLTHAVFGCAL